MTTTLLTTKLSVPPAPSGMVRRPRLVKRLDAGLGGKLTLVSAPAGYGKTTLVSEWVRTQDGFNASIVAAKGICPSRATAWLSLDEGDNDPVRFLTLLSAALGQIECLHADVGESVVDILRSPQPPPTEDVLTLLVNGIADIPHGVVLVMDDYHLIENRAVQDALTFLIEYVPPNLHLVIASRDDPSLRLARLRARGQMAEVRAADLRFSPAETAEFLNMAMGLNLSARDVAALEDRTEGWIAGLHLAALSMQRMGKTDAFIRSFTGSHRYVLDYLIDEVLAQQPSHIREFLLQTSILGKMSGSLCDAVTATRRGQEMLAGLDRANLFIVPLDQERCWYRYHHLFADLLRRRLRQTQADTVPMLHLRASMWYEEEGVLSEAIEHALQSTDHDRAAELIERYADDAWEGGEHSRLTSWLARLPEDAVFGRPLLCIYHAWYQFISGQWDSASTCLHSAERALRMGHNAFHLSPVAPEDTGERQMDLEVVHTSRLRGRLAAIRSFMASYEGDVPRIIDLTGQALDSLLPDDVNWRMLTMVALSDAHSYTGDMNAAYETRLAAMEACESHGSPYYAVLAALKVIVTLRELGQLRETLRACEQQLGKIHECGLSKTAMAGWLIAIKSEVQAELGDLEGALSDAKPALELSERGANLAFLAWSYFSLLRVYLAAGRLDDAQSMIRRATDRGRQSHCPLWYTSQMANWQARIWLARGDVERAARWARDQGLSAGKCPDTLQETGYFLLLDCITLARLMMAQSRLDECYRLLGRLEISAEAGGRRSRVIEILILKALCLDARDEPKRAQAVLERALTLAEPERYVQVFVDEGPPMARLLYGSASLDLRTDYVSRLLTAFPLDEARCLATTSAAGASLDLVEPLSDREVQVLQLIANGLSNQSIADRLFLSLNTVKAHTRNIYGKLGVNSRTQAVARANQYGVLRDE